MTEVQRNREVVARLTRELLDLPETALRERRLSKAEVAWWLELAILILEVALPIGIGSRIALIAIRRAYDRAHLDAFGNEWKAWSADAVLRRTEED